MSNRAEELFDGSPHRYDLFDNGDDVPAKNYTTTAGAPAKNVRAAVDAARPSAGANGRYTLPNPVGGKSKSWQRVTTFVGLAADTYHLDLWTQRNVAKGVAIMATAPGASSHAVASMDVKSDKARLDRIVRKAKDVAGANKAANRGTELHGSTEDADYAGSWQDPYSILKVTPDDRPQVQLYLDTLRMHGLEVAYLDDGTPCIERVTASQKYETAGTLDRVLREADGSYVVADLKTKDSLDFGRGEIAAQLANYEDGINYTGIWDGRTYNRSVVVRRDYGLVIWLPQSSPGICEIRKVYLDEGREIARVCAEVRESRRVASRVEFEDYAVPALSQDERDAYWLEQANAAHTMDELIDVVDRARSFGQYNERLAGQARVIAAGLPL